MHQTIFTPFISICIPAYKRTAFLKRLLDSIMEQAFVNFEVIVTDDSPNDEVEQLCNQYISKFPLKYLKNQTSLGTPENWNEGIRKTSGQWIKIMHDDDWFANPDALGKFAAAIENNPEVNFFFSAHNNVFEKDNTIQPVYLSNYNKRRLEDSFLYLLHSNHVGNPSCTLFNKSIPVVFDNRMKFVVDFDFYMQYLKKVQCKFIYLNAPLVNVGINDTQVTNYTFRVNKVEIPENHLMLTKLGTIHLKNIFVYDYFWRLYRNLGIRNARQVREDGYEGDLNGVLKSMIRWQSLVPIKLLKIRPFSKLLMFTHYCTHYLSIK